jgi:hypothetical protein
MPRKVDYASRFQFFREAAFAIVRDRGVAALSRRSLANELGISRNRVDDVLRAEADLRVLAADDVRSRRRSGRFGSAVTTGTEAALHVVTSLMPDDPERIDEELVWLRLLVEGPRAASPTPDPEGPLWARYQIAERGYIYDDRTAEAVADPGAVDALSDHRALRDEVMAGQLERALEAIGLDKGAHDLELLRLRAVVDGLTLAVCLGHLSPAVAVSVAAHHLGQLASG